jgi:hypothetical protein
MPVRKLLARELGDLRSATGGSPGCPRREGEEPKPILHEPGRLGGPIVAASNRAGYAHREKLRQLQAGGRVLPLRRFSRSSST